MTATLFGWLDREKFYFLLSVVPPIASSIYIVLFLRRSPQAIIESVSSFVPGLRKPTFKDGMACFRLEASADVIQALNKIMREQTQIMSSDLRAMGVHRQLFQDGAGAFRRFTRRLTQDLPAWAESENAEQHRSHGLGTLSHRRLPSEPSPSIHEEHSLEEGASSTGHSPPCGHSSNGEVGSGVRELWVNPKHLSLLSLVPTSFMSMYFWDATGLSREASEDFPLDKCLGGDSHCFYITQPYSIWRYPKYTKLECDEMRAKTLASAAGFFFAKPEGAQFYKCYTWVFNSQNFIQASGDVVALLAVIVIVLLYFCVEVTSGFDRHHRGGRAEAIFLEELKRQRRRCLIWQAVLVIIGISAIATVEFIYGKLTNDFEAYLGVPGLCLFGVINFQCRRGLLEQRIADLEKEDSDSDESSEEADGLPALTAASAPAALMALMASLGAGRPSAMEAPPAPPTSTTCAPRPPPLSTLPLQPAPMAGLHARRA